jgi:hypothetical protein
MATIVKTFLIDFFIYKIIIYQYLTNISGETG